MLRLASILWLAALAGFVIGGIGVLREVEWTLPATIATTVLSTVLSVMWYRDAPFGLLANAGVIVALVVPAVRDRIFP